MVSKLICPFWTSSQDDPWSAEVETVIIEKYFRRTEFVSSAGNPASEFEILFSGRDTVYPKS